MPHKQAECVYCAKPMDIGRIHPTMTPYHGECRLVELRRLWLAATTDLERDIRSAEANAIKDHMKKLSHETA